MYIGTTATYLEIFNYTRNRLYGFPKLVYTHFLLLSFKLGMVLMNISLKVYLIVGSSPRACPSFKPFPVTRSF